MSTPPVCLSSDPSTDVRYLRSPVLTVLESIEDIHQDYLSFHDLVEAYHTFCSRLKGISGVLCDETANVPALCFLEEQSVPFIQCLRKHVRGALVDPMLTASQRSSALVGVFRPDHWQSTPVTDEDIKLARDTALLCQSALRTVSYILRFPALSAVFDGESAPDFENKRNIEVRMKPTILYTSPKTCLMYLTAPVYLSLMERRYRLWLFG